MPELSRPDYKIKDAGSPISTGLRQQLLELTVEETLNGAAVATIKFRDDAGAISGGTALKVGNEVAIELGYAGATSEVFEGEVVSWKGAFAQLGKETLTVIAFDRFHRLRRNRRQKTWLKMTDAAIASEVASGAGCGLTAETDTSPVTHEALHQWNQTDADFILERAGLFGWVAYVDKKKLHFHPPRLDSAKVATCEWHKGLHSFNCAISLSQQQAEVKVTGWNMLDKAPVTATANSERSMMGAASPGKTPAGELSPPPTHGSVTPAATQGEAQAYADGMFHQRSERFVTGEGSCQGDPAIRRDKVVELTGIGALLSGNYFVQSATHTLKMGMASGYTTNFRVLRPALDTPEKPEPPPVATGKAAQPAKGEGISDAEPEPSKDIKAELDADMPAAQAEIEADPPNIQAELEPGEKGAEAHFD